ncbi:hypothetical protein [Daejeonella lutea]|nr:hypothetical protein [Daejeonella lutea]
MESGWAESTGKSGKWKVESGKWKVESGKWKVAGRKVQEEGVRGKVTFDG